jgi:Transposase and inactivated derivatives
MSHKNGNRYSEDFRKMIVRLYHAGQSVSELVSEYGVSDVSIYNWIREYKHINPEDSESPTMKEVSELQKEIIRLKRENEILKKAIAVFAKE